MMTIREWFELAKAAGLPWADEALHMCVHPHVKVERLSEAIAKAFNWGGNRVDWRQIISHVIDHSMAHGGGSYDDSWVREEAEKRKLSDSGAADSGWRAYDAVREAFLEAVEKWRVDYISIPAAFVGLAKAFERIDRERGGSDPG